MRISGRNVLSDVDLTAERGWVVGLMGPNGSGKTTFLKLLAGLVVPWRGELEVCGRPLGDGRGASRGIMFEFPPFLEDRSGLENLRLLSRYGTPVTCDLPALMERVGIDPASRLCVRSYSQGMRKRLALAQAVMGGPDVLLLDEPMNGLDPEGMLMMRDVIREQSARGCTVVISSHLLSELERLCDRVYMVRGGRFEQVVVGQGSSLEGEYLCRLG